MKKYIHFLFILAIVLLIPKAMADDCSSKLQGEYLIDFGGTQPYKFKIEQENNLWSGEISKEDNQKIKDEIFYRHKSEVEADRLKLTFAFSEFDNVKDMCFVGQKNSIEHFYYINVNEASKEELNTLFDYISQKFNKKYTLDAVKEMRYFFIIEGDLLTPIYMIFPAKKIP